MMWVVLAVNGLLVLWLAWFWWTNTVCAGMVGEELDTCRADRAVVVGMFLVVWAAVNVILGVVFLVTRRGDLRTS